VPGYDHRVSKPRHAAALVVGVFVAVVAVVLGATAATGWRTHHHEAPAASAHAPVSPLAAVSQGGGQIPGSFSSRIPDTSMAAQDAALQKRAGVLVARGKDFRIEQVTLTKPTSVSVRGTTIQATSVYRITITAGPYQMRDMPNVVSLNQRPLAIGMESADLTSLTAFTFDRSVLTDGAALTVSYGPPSSQSTTWTSAIEVVK
jgi:hypothetical protein